ncbi:hypothetical protein [Phormidesmis priestleyi]|nr:hypothetical protein [Phormidesmis priestleyi]
MQVSGLFTYDRVLYTLMTIDSARRHWQRKGGAWKGRVYEAIKSEIKN